MRPYRGVLIFLILFFIGHQIIGGTKCNDGWMSPSIGTQGACSHHGGVNHTPRNIVLIISIVGGVLASGFVGSRPTINRPRSGKPSQLGQQSDEVPRRKSIPKCPKCGSSMKVRTPKNSRNSNDRFYGCVRWPRCTGIRDKF
jgi:hypothetical protein